MRRLTSVFPREVRGVAHGLGLGGMLYGALAVTVVTGLPFRRDRERIRRLTLRVARTAVPRALSAGGVRVVSQVSDAAAEVTSNRGYILVANHSSNLDPLALMKVLGRVDLAFVAKAETLRRPLLGELLDTIGWFKVERQSMAALKKLCEEARARQETGWVPNIVVFPEGTRSTDGKLGKFQIGPFLLAADLQLPIVPAAIRGAAELHGKNHFKVYPGTVEVEIGDPIVIADEPLKPLERVDAAAAGLETTVAWFEDRLADSDELGSDIETSTPAKEVA